MHAYVKIINCQNHCQVVLCLLGCYVIVMTVDIALLLPEDLQSGPEMTGCEYGGGYGPFRASALACVWSIIHG